VHVLSRCTTFVHRLDPVKGRRAPRTFYRACVLAPHDTERDRVVMPARSQDFCLACAVAGRCLACAVAGLLPCLRGRRAFACLRAFRSEGLYAPRTFLLSLRAGGA